MYNIPRALFSKGNIFRERLPQPNKSYAREFHFVFLRLSVSPFVSLSISLAPSLSLSFSQQWPRPPFTIGPFPRQSLKVRPCGLTLTPLSHSVSLFLRSLTDPIRSVGTGLLVIYTVDAHTACTSSRHIFFYINVSTVKYIPNTTPYNVGIYCRYPQLTSTMLWYSHRTQLV